MEPLQLIMVALVFCLMLGLGSTVRPQNLKDIMKNPKPPIIGFIAQFVLMPVSAYALAKIVDVPKPHGLAMILIGCSPGGSTSNLFTYFSRGDLPLSIAMTVISNFSAFFMMPLLLLIFGPSFSDKGADIPYAQIMLGLLVVLVPVAIGMCILQKSEAVAKKLEKGASILGTIFIAGAIIAGVRGNPGLFLSGWKMYFTAIFMLPLASSFGYGLSALAGLPPKQSRTIFLETGIQNTTLTIAIIALSYPLGTAKEKLEDGTDDLVGMAENAAKKKLQDDIMGFALMYSFFLIVGSVIMTLIFRKISANEKEEEPVVKKPSGDAVHPA